MVYEVRGILADGYPANGNVYEVIGWTTDSTGGKLLEGAEKWPRYRKAYVADLHADQGTKG